MPKLPPFVTEAALELLDRPPAEARELVTFLASSPSEAAWAERASTLGDVEPFCLAIATEWHDLGANMRAKWPVIALARVGSPACVRWLVPVALEWGERGLRSGIELATDVYRQVIVSNKEGAGVALLHLVALADSKSGADNGIAGRAFTALGGVEQALRLSGDKLRWLRLPSVGLSDFDIETSIRFALRASSIRFDVSSQRDSFGASTACSCASPKTGHSKRSSKRRTRPSPAPK